MAVVSLSLVLILFALAGGHMKDQVTLLNLPLSFDRPWVLLVAAWVIWMYFLYRYLLVAQAPFKEFSEEVRIRVMSNRDVREMARAAFDRAPIPEERRMEEFRRIEEGWRYGIARHEGKYCFTTSRIYDPAKQAAPAGTTDYGLIPLTAAEVWIYRRAQVSATLKAMALETTFSDDLLPLFLVVITPPIWAIFYSRIATIWIVKLFT